MISGRSFATVGASQCVCVGFVLVSLSTPVSPDQLFWREFDQLKTPTANWSLIVFEFSVWISLHAYVSDEWMSSKIFIKFYRMFSLLFVTEHSSNSFYKLNEFIT